MGKERGFLSLNSSFLSLRTGILICSQPLCKLPQPQPWAWKTRWGWWVGLQKAAMFWHSKSFPGDETAELFSHLWICSEWILPNPQKTLSSLGKERLAWALGLCTRDCQSGQGCLMTYESGKEGKAVWSPDKNVGLKGSL